MDSYDYNEEQLSMVAGNCRYHSYRQGKSSSRNVSGVSCNECRSWTGSGCSRKQFDSISSELQLD